VVVKGKQAENYLLCVNKIDMAIKGTARDCKIICMTSGRGGSLEGPKYSLSFNFIAC
jgi:hypothetical protein